MAGFKAGKNGSSAFWDLIYIGGTGQKSESHGIHDSLFFVAGRVDSLGLLWVLRYWWPLWDTLVVSWCPFMRYSH